MIKVYPGRQFFALHQPAAQEKSSKKSKKSKKESKRRQRARVSDASASSDSSIDERIKPRRRGKAFEDDFGYTGSGSGASSSNSGEDEPMAAAAPALQREDWMTKPAERPAAQLQQEQEKEEQVLFCAELCFEVPCRALAFLVVVEHTVLWFAV